MLPSMHMGAAERKEAVPLLDGAHQNITNIFRHVNCDPQTKNFSDSILVADSMRSTGPARRSLSSVLWGKFSSHERNDALQKEGVGSAAFLIRDAVLGEEYFPNGCRYNPYSTHSQKEWRNMFAIICGRLSGYPWMVGLVQVAAWMIALLTFIEPPYWCRHGDFAMLEFVDYEDNKFGSCGVLLNAKGQSPDGETSVYYYPSSSAMWVSIEESRAVEWVCLPIVTFYLILKFGRDGFDVKRFFINGHSHWTCTLQSFLIIFLYYTLLTKYSKYDPFVRLFLLGSFMRDFQREAYTLIKMLPKISIILAQLAVLIFFYGWFGVVLFYGTEQGKRDFSNLVEACWTLWICVTTANYPDVMMPSYNHNRLTGLFFVTFMILSFFFLMNLILATVVNAYTDAIEDRKKSRDYLSYRNLTKAFNLMDPRGSGRIDKDTIMAVFLILNEDFPEFRTLSREETKLLFGFLDKDGTSGISLKEFQNFGSVLLLEFTKTSDYATFVETHFPKFYQSTGYQSFCDGVRSRYFEYAVDITLVLNAFLIAFLSYPELSGQPDDTDPRYSNGSIDTFWELVETIFTLVYSVEVLIKVTVYGWRTYRESPRHMFDFSVTILAVFATLYVYNPNTNTHIDSRMVRCIVMMRILPLIRILFLIGSISAEIIPAAAGVIVFLFFLMYLFSAVGMLLYGGMITRDPSNPLSYAILGNYFSDNDYWANNFNDMISGLNVLFNLLVVNNWTNCEIGFEAVTDGKMVRFFFLGFHILGVILVNNLVIAFIINAFFQELETIYPRSREDSYRYGEEILKGEAILRGEQAMFDASEVTGTKTGAKGGYIARIHPIHRDVKIDEREGLRKLFTPQSSYGTDKKGYKSVHWDLEER